MALTARIDELKKKFDENPRRYFAPLANEFRKAGDAGQAILICEEFLPQQPGHMSGHIVYGQALYEAQRFGEARATFETALELDPENVLALRHLGDIARDQGDPDAAKVWYWRVLDADPRNEEIQGLIAQLTANGDSARGAPPLRGAAGSSSPSPGGDPLSAVSYQPSSSASASTPAFGPPSPSAEQATTPPNDDLLDDSLLDSDLRLRDDEPAREVSAAELDAASRRDVTLDDFSLEGIESEPDTESLMPATDMRQPAEEPADFFANERSSVAGFELDAPFESGIDSFAAPASQSFALEGLENTSDGGMWNEEPSSGAFEPLDIEGGLIPVDSDAAERATDEVARPVIEAVDMDDADTFDVPVELPAAVIAAEAELTELDEVGVREEQPFVTETMAELYVKQGLQAEALAVFKQLSKASPDDDHLRRRIAELEHLSTIAPPAALGAREFFARIASHRPRSTEAAREMPEQDDFASSDTEHPLPAYSPPVTQPSVVGDGASGPIDALFGARSAAATVDDPNGSALAQAFGGETASTPPLTGRPARTAAGELSLDSVFRAGGARSPNASPSFSFDQFFSDGAAATTDTAGAVPPVAADDTARGEPAERSADDIEQFNTWLQGLKQR